jgi:hypothetical protein
MARPASASFPGLLDGFARMTANITVREAEVVERRSAIMTSHHSFNHRVRQAAILAVALGACLIFGIAVLASGDWLPGAIIVIASTVGLAREIPVVRSRRSTGDTASPPTHNASK